MAEEGVSRNEFISKIGNFFIVEGVQALQTRDAGATRAAPSRLPTPTLVPLQSANRGNESIAYFPAFCLGSIGLLFGWFFKRISAPPHKPSNRFEGIRKMQQKQREAKAKKEAEKKEKEKKKK